LLAHHLVQRFIRLAKGESRRLFFFGLIGGASLAMNVGLYAWLSRLVWPGGNRTFIYAIVVVVVTLFNFEANRHFTFASKRSAGALFRFGMVAVVASGMNTGLFWMGHSLLGFYDLAVIVANTLLIALFTFSSHRLFTFHPNPWRHARRKTVRSDDGWIFRCGDPGSAPGESIKEVASLERQRD
jgi:putative flippase GtrA